MSEQQTLFIKTETREMPTLGCIGTVTEIGEPKLSESGDYVCQPIKVEPFGAGRTTTKTMLYRPEWLKAGFDPGDYLEAAKKCEKGSDKERQYKAYYFVYSNNIAADESYSVLAGLAGSDEGFVRLQQALLACDSEKMEDVAETLRSFFLGENDGTEIGYDLKQQREKTDKIGSDGKVVYKLKNQYEIGQFWYPTEAKVKSLVKRAEKSGGKYKITFETE